MGQWNRKGRGDTPRHTHTTQISNNHDMPPTKRAGRANTSPGWMGATSNSKCGTHTGVVCGETEEGGESPGNPEPGAAGRGKPGTLRGRATPERATTVGGTSRAKAEIGTRGPCLQPLQWSLEREPDHGVEGDAAGTGGCIRCPSEAARPEALRGGKA